MNLRKIPYLICLFSGTLAIHGAATPMPRYNKETYADARIRFWSESATISEREKAIADAARQVDLIESQFKPIFQHGIAQMSYVLALLKLPSAERLEKFNEIAKGSRILRPRGSREEQMEALLEEGIFFTPYNIGEIAKMIMSTEKQEKVEKKEA